MELSEVSDKLESALRVSISEMNDHEEGDILVEWVVVAYVTNPDNEKMSAYPMLYSNGGMPTHRARGLLTTGLEYLSVGKDE